MPTSKRYDYNGSNYSWTVPANIDPNVPVHLDLYGAGNGSTAGGHSAGVCAVAAGDQLVIIPGGKNGFGGGGAGDGGGTDGINNSSAQNGAGATIVCKNGSAPANQVAFAAGAGGSITVNGSKYRGGSGGPSGGDGEQNNNGGGHGATPSAGGAGGVAGSGQSTGGNGARNQGGAGKNNGGTPILTPCGGGGGGYYGGGGGGGQGSGGASASGAGGGGSNYIGGLTGTLVNETSSNTGNGYALVAYNLIPNAPTLAFPPNNGYIDTTTSNAFTCVFSDDDDTDSISAIEVRYRIGTGAWTTTDKQAAEVAQWIYAGATFTPYLNQRVEWQARTWDSDDAVSAWSSSGFFTPANPPAAFAFGPALASVDSKTQTITGDNGGGQFVQYRARVVLDDGFGNPTGALLLDTGPTALPGAPVTSLSVQLPFVDYVNGQTVHILVVVYNPTGVMQHGWTDSGPLTVNIAPPAEPLISVRFITQLDDGTPCAATYIEWINPTSSDPSLAVDHVDIYRAVSPANDSRGHPQFGPYERIYSGPPNSYFIDLTPPGDQQGCTQVDYQAHALTATGAEAISA